MQIRLDLHSYIFTRAQQSRRALNSLRTVSYFPQKQTEGGKNFVQRRQQSTQGPKKKKLKRSSEEEEGRAKVLYYLGGKCLNKPACWGGRKGRTTEEVPRRSRPRVERGRKEGGNGKGQGREGAAENILRILDQRSAAVSRSGTKRCDHRVAVAPSSYWSDRALNCNT